MTIRLAVAADREAVERCVREAYAHYVPRIGCRPQPMTADYRGLIAAGVVHVADDDGRLVGVLVLKPEQSSLTENQSFYRARGFVETERRTEGHFARVFMSKTLEA